jgi:hexosaminidase
MGLEMHLLPMPKEINLEEGTFIIEYNTKIVINNNCSNGILHIAKILKESIMKELGFDLPILRTNKIMEHSINLIEYCSKQDENSSKDSYSNESISNESYSMDINDHGIFIKGSKKGGVLYGVQTLRQIISTKGAVLPTLRINDGPEIPNRGFYHDVTRGRIPTLDSLKKLADKLSHYKLNQLQLYVEHSFLFSELSEVWRDDTPLTAEEILELDEYCKKLNIELIPSIASFGHLYKLLSTKTYSHLCELEDSDKSDFSFFDRMQHHTVDVTNEESFEVIKYMIEEFMPLFSSNHFNICSDETFDLGKGKSKALAEAIGTDRVYVNFLKRLCDLIISHKKRPMFWGDIILGEPSALKELPEEVICLNWGYSPDEKEDNAKKIYEIGATQYLCPGVHGWNHIINRNDYGYNNIKSMCDYAKRYHAIGVLNTDWGDFGHINHPEFSTAGLIYGAAFSWSNLSIEFSEINKQISMLEYKDKSGRFVDIISDLAKQELFTWEFIVMWKERYSHGESLDQLSYYFQNCEPTRVIKVNHDLDEIIYKLYETVSVMDTSTRGFVKAYIIAAKGLQVFNMIGSVVYAKHHHSSFMEIPSTTELAKNLEHWFYDYKMLWRQHSKESELYQVQELINWYGDFLRNL